MPESSGIGEFFQGTIQDSRNYAIKKDEIDIQRANLERQREQMELTRQQHKIEMSMKVMDDWKGVAENALSPNVQKALIAKIKSGYAQMGWQWDSVLEASMKDDAGRDEFLRAYSNMRNLSPSEQGEVMVNGAKYMKEGQLWDGLKSLNTWADEKSKITQHGDETVRNTRVAGDETRKTEVLKALLKDQAAGKKGSLTKGEEALDKKFAGTYEEFVAAGGASEVKKNLDQLRGVADKLKSNNGLTGFVAGNLPDFIGSTVKPESVDARQVVEQVLTKNLRAVFGAQFTENEGKQFMARAFNPRLSPEVNRKRLGDAIQQIEGAATAKINASLYFEQNGTLKGFKGTTINSVSDLLKNKPAGPPAPGSAAATAPARVFSPSLVGKLKKLRGAGKTRAEIEAAVGQALDPQLAKEVGF